MDLHAWSVPENPDRRRIRADRGRERRRRGRFEDL